MKIKTIFAAALAAVAMTSCDSGSNEYHSTYFYPMTGNGIETYADQTVDSVRVYSTDSWTLDNSCEWVDIYSAGKKAPLSITIPAGYMASSRLDFQLQPNTTGEARTTIVQVKSTFDKIGAVTQYLTQYPFHKIISPSGKTVTDEDGKRSYLFQMEVNANGFTGADATPSLIFYPYASDATLSCPADWVMLSKMDDFAKETKHIVTVTCTKNTTGEDRTATIKLTAGGVTTPIIVKQLK